jgi:hypothetical protein
MARGRPPKEDKLTNSEKSKRYRDRKREEEEGHLAEIGKLRDEIMRLKAQIGTYRMRCEVSEKEMVELKLVLELLRASNASKKVATPKVATREIGCDTDFFLESETENV